MAKPRPARIPPPHPTLACPSTAKEITAVQALFNGTADAHQQKLAIMWIMECAAGVSMPTFQPDSAHATDFMLGRRFVADQILIARLRSPEFIARKAHREKELETLEQET